VAAASPGPAAVTTQTNAITAHTLRGNARAPGIIAAIVTGDSMTANPYLTLGVRPFINCCSVRTMHGGSLMLPQVRAAVDAA
jgi:hypothetical protein